MQRHSRQSHPQHEVSRNRSRSQRAFLAHRKSLLAAALLSFAGAQACQEPTQLTVEIFTDIRCSDHGGTEITVGPLDVLSERPPAAATDQCDPSTGRIGSLVVLPKDDKDAPVSFQVKTGFGQAVSVCEESSQCIIARRALHFIEHTPLRIDVLMQGVCRGVACHSTETCLAGRCVSAEIDADDCRGEGCGTAPFDPGSHDAGVEPDSGPDADIEPDGGPVEPSCTPQGPGPLLTGIPTQQTYLTGTSDGFATSWQEAGNTQDELLFRRFSTEASPQADTVLVDSGQDIVVGSLAARGDRFAVLYKADEEHWLSQFEPGGQAKIRTATDNITFLPIRGLVAQEQAWGYVGVGQLSNTLAFGRVSYTGNLQPGPIYATEGSPSWATLHPSGDDYVAMWMRFVGGHRQVYTQQLFASGEGGTARQATNRNADTFNPSGARGADNRWLIAWHERAGSSRRAYVQLLNVDRAPSEEAILLDETAATQTPLVVALGSGYAVVYLQERGDLFDLTWRRIGADGTPQGMPETLAQGLGAPLHSTTAGGAGLHVLWRAGESTGTPADVHHAFVCP